MAVSAIAQLRQQHAQSVAVRTVQATPKEELPNATHWRRQRTEPKAEKLELPKR